MAALRYILLAAAITLTLTLLAHLVLPARGPIPRRTGRREIGRASCRERV